MNVSTQSHQDAVWKQRFRLPVTYGLQIAGRDPARGLVLSTHSGVDQLYAWQVSTGTLRQMTFRPEGTGSSGDSIPDALLSPDGGFVYYFNDVQGNEIGHFVRVPYTGGPPEDLTPDLPSYAGFSFNFSASGNRCAFTMQSDNIYAICSLDIYADGSLGPPAILYQSALQTRGPVFSYNGEVAVIETKDAGSADYHFVAVGVPTGKEIASLTEEEGGLELYLASPLPDDLRFLALSSHTGSWRPFLWNAESGERVDIDLGQLEGDLVPMDWAAPDPLGSLILLRQDTQVRQRLWIYDVEQRRAWRLENLGGGTYGTTEPRSIFFGPDEEIYALWESSSQPLQAVALERDTGLWKRELFAIGSSPPGHPWRSVTFPSSDGQQIQGWLALPPGEGPFPAIIEAHGGPEFAVTDMFSPPSQSWVDHGFAYLTVNYRGSTGFGKAFQEQIRGQLGRWEVEDLVAAHRWLVQQRIAIPEQVLLTGWSWGGYLTLQALGTHPGTWAGGMAGMALSDLVMNDASSTIRAYIRSLMGGSPEELPEQYRASSPITYIDQVDAPLIIIQGRNDARCPPQQIVAYEERMRALGKDVAVYWFDAGHGPVETEERISQQELLLRFAERVLAPGN